MSFIDLAFIFIAVIMVIAGARRGLVVSLLSTVRFIIGVPLSFFVGENYSQWAYDSFVREIAYKKVSQRLAESESLDSIINSVNEFTSSLPDLFTQRIDVSSLKGKTLSFDEISIRITDTIVEPIAVIILKIILIIVTFLAFFIVSGLLISFIKRLRRGDKTPLKKADALLGGVFGIIKALAFIFALATILSYVCNIVPQDNIIVKQADNSFILEFINSYNPLVK